MFRSYTKEKKNNITFILMIVFLMLSYVSKSSLLLYLLLFGGFSYGLFSKNPVKSLLLGFLIPFSMLILMILDRGYVENIPVYSLILSVSGALSGGFAAMTAKSDKGVFYLFTALFFLLIGILYFISGIN